SRDRLAAGGAVRRRRPQAALPGAVPRLRRRAPARRRPVPRTRDVSGPCLRAIRTGKGLAPRRGLMADLNEQLNKHIDEAYAMEQNVLRMLDGMIETSEDAEGVSAVRRQ